MHAPKVPTTAKGWGECRWSPLKKLMWGEISVDSAKIKRKSVIGIANQQKQLEIKKKRAAAFCLGESEVV